MFHIPLFFISDRLFVRTPPHERSTPEYSLNVLTPTPPCSPPSPAPSIYVDQLSVHHTVLPGRLELGLGFLFSRGGPADRFDSSLFVRAFWRFDSPPLESVRWRVPVLLVRAFLPAGLYPVRLGSPHSTFRCCARRFPC